MLNSNRITFTNMSDKDARTGNGIYVKRFDIPTDQREALVSACGAGYNLDAVNSITNSFHVGMTGGAYKRWMNGNTDVSHPSEMYLMKVGQDRNLPRLEVFVLYMLHSNGKRVPSSGPEKSGRWRKQGSDSFLLSPDDITELQDKIARYNSTGELSYTLIGEGIIDIEHFADSDAFWTWWNAGWGKGMSKPTRSAEWIAANPPTLSDWDVKFRDLVTWMEQYDELPSKGKEPGSREYDLEKWLVRQQKLYKDKHTSRQFKMFDEAGIDLNAKETLWKEKLRQYGEYVEKYDKEPSTESPLGKWIKSQRANSKKAPYTDHAKKLKRRGYLGKSRVSISTNLAELYQAVSL